MKQIVWSGKVNGKTVKGNWFCENRPNRAQTIAERLVGNRINFFRFIIKEVKITMVKVAEEE